MPIQWLDQMHPAQLPVARGRYPWGEICTELMDRPGVWARVLINVPRSHASAITAGDKRPVDPQRFWATTRGVTGTRADLFMVYVPDDEAKHRAREHEPPR